MNNIPKTTEHIRYNNSGLFPAQRFPADHTLVEFGLNPGDTTAKKLLLIFYTWDGDYTMRSTFLAQTTKEVTLLTR